MIKIVSLCVVLGYFIWIKNDLLISICGSVQSKKYLRVVMKIILLFVLSAIVIAPLNAQEIKPTNFRVQDEFHQSIDDLDYNKKNISIISENGDEYFKSLEEIEFELNEGMKLYKKGEYEQAYVILSELSQWGIKDAQTVLGNMFIKGEHVDKSVERGLAWLGVAK